MRPPRPGLVRNAIGSLGVLGIVAFVAFGLPLIDRSLPGQESVAARAPFAIGGAVSVVPPPGASIDLTKTRPTADRGTVLFLVDGVRYAIVVAPFRGSLDEAARRLRAKITNTSGFQVAGGERALWTAAGVAGRRGTYSSPGRLGEYSVFVAHGLTVEVTASGPEDRLRAADDALDTSMRTVAFGGRRS